MNATNKLIVTKFIEEVWNQNQLEKIDDYIATNFIDHSLPPNLPANKEGMKQWIIATGKSFEHQTMIDAIVCEDHKVMVKINMLLKHIGVWRNIEPTHLEIAAVGYRYYKISGGRIIEHWSLLDGNSIENQLTACQHGCKIQK